MNPPLLKVDKLKKHFPVRGGLLRRVQAQLRAVDGVSFELQSQRTLGLVGESGCGKSTLGRAILRLHEPTSGQLWFDGQDLTRLRASELKARRKDMQMIFQDPFASLSPRRTVFETLREPLDLHQIGASKQRKARIAELLDIVGLRSEAMHRYPHEFSGGQRQRIAIARALAVEPKLIVADEAVSALDVSVQSQVLNLIGDLQRELGVAFLFISHDLAVVQHVSHDVGVMYLGKLVEKASVERIYSMPSHPYTKALLSAVPVPEPGTNKAGKRSVPEGDVPSPIQPPPGCAFHTRCPRAMPVCRSIAPNTINIGSDAEPHHVRCHLYDDAIETD
ncbi:MAG: dipeptide ABC transporter ATP-binding protein [Pseudomonadota bacterium]